MSQPTADPDDPLKGAAGNLTKRSFIGIIWPCFVVATAFISIRLTVRFRHNHGLFPDDLWIIGAWFCFLVMLIIQMMQAESLWYAAEYFSGRLSLDNPTMLYQAGQLLRWQFPISTLFLMTLWSVKASFLATFYRLVYPLRWARWAWWFILNFTAASFVGCIFTMLFMCDTPTEFFTPGQCQTPGENWMHVFAIGYSTGVDVVTDLMIVALSLSVLRTLRLDKSKKLGVATAFSLVVIIIIVAMVRIELVVSHEEVDMVGLAVWSVVEAMTALIVGSLMPLSGLLSKVISKISSNRSRPQQYMGGSDNHVSQSPHAEESGSNSGLFPELQGLQKVQRGSDSTGVGGYGGSSGHIRNSDYLYGSDGDEVALSTANMDMSRSNV